MVIIRSVLIFNLDNLVMRSKKYELVCHPRQTKLLLEDLISYMHKENKTVEIDIMILEKEAKSSFTLFSLKRCPGVCVIKSLCIALVELSKS